MKNHDDEQKKIVVIQFLAYAKKIAVRTHNYLLKKEERRKNAEHSYSKNQMLLETCSEFNTAESSSGYVGFELNDLLDKLTQKQRYIITYNIIYGYSENEIAAYMQITQQSVSKIKERGLNTIRKMMGVSHGNQFYKK